MRKPPPLLLGASLLFWGWQTEMFALGVVGALILEFSHVFPGRWNFTDKEFNRLWDVCTFLFVGAGVYLRFSEEVTSAAYTFFQWFPVVFFPMAAGHIYSARDAVPLKAFSWFLRQKGREGGDRPIAFGWVYLVVCAATAGAANLRTLWFYVGIAVIAGWALFAIRPLRLPVWAWVPLFAGLATAGFYFQARLPELQMEFENRASEFFLRFSRREFDPRESKTSMGRIGSLKQSSRIVMKVRAENGPVPGLLRQATYTRLEGTTWRGSGRSFESVPIETDLTTWTLHPDTNNARAVRIIERLPKKTAMLSVPVGTTQLRELSVVGVETNRFAVIRTSENPALASYIAHFGAADPEGPPQLDAQFNFDLQIPDDEADAIKRVAARIAPKTLPAEQIPGAIGRYFSDHFRYTTYQSAREVKFDNVTPLAHFLLESRAGHCEFFATATVLLLRQFGIPARYATGFSVSEADEEGLEFVVRERHGHAWALAFLDGRWVEIDTTPAGWAVEEEKEDPFYEPLSDAWERLTFSFLEWRWLGERGFVAAAAPWLLGPLVLFLAWRVFGRRMVRRVQRVKRFGPEQGADSEYYLLEKKLKRAGLGRREHETAAQWVARVRQEHPVPELPQIVRLHYKHRFSPGGLGGREREQLRTLVRDTLEQQDFRRN